MRTTAWGLLALLLLTAALGVAADQSFSRFSGKPAHPELQRDSGVRVVWRMPGTIETSPAPPVLALLASFVVSEALPAMPLLSPAIFVPPRS